MTYASPSLLQPGSAAPPRRVLVLCFDGTGNKFSGDASDSNIVKIYSLLDRRDDNQWHYYQPGIGTYVETSSLSSKSAIVNFKSWYVKAKDQLIGTSFSEHVMAGYRFLMRYYADGDAIYFFGFSRGAYTARFLAQMLDYVGLLSCGNEEMLRFAWKTFARWQMRTDETERGKREKRELFQFMKKFRSTFSRPVCRPEFLGLFDCVNSVPQFESAWMSRTKFPYTAKTSARVIRHAVAIDERRAKFRQDLISEKRVNKHHHEAAMDQTLPEKRPCMKRLNLSQPLFRPVPRIGNMDGGSSRISQTSVDSGTHFPHQGVEEEENDQDILELWFAGQHGDIGGGWPLKEGEERPLSDIALMWMLKEARKAGLPLDEQKVQASNLFPPETIIPDPNKETPLLQLDGRPFVNAETAKQEKSTVSFHEAVHRIATTSKVHDTLEFGGGLNWMSVLAWRFMEHVPFRRMDLQPDGSWRAISWPLPRGETRDMYHDCKIHTSVIKRMENDPQYRPGNLIVGGGGRGVRRAPEHYGVGSWKVVHEEGDVVGEAYVKALIFNGS